MTTLNTQSTVSPMTRHEATHRYTALGLAAVMTLSILGSIHLLAAEPEADSLLAQQGRLVVSAPASSPQA